VATLRADLADPPNGTQREFVTHGNVAEKLTLSLTEENSYKPSSQTLEAEALLHII
jgi:hypothetical protein